MTRTASVLIAAALLCVAGCGDGTLVPAAGEVTYEGSYEPASEAPTDQAPIDQAPIDQAPIDQAPIDQAPTATPASPTATPSAPLPAPRATPPASPPASTTDSPSTGSPSPALASVRRDVAEVAPALERFYQDREYPLDLAQVRSTLAEAGVRLGAGNTVAGYDYDGDAVEFELCIENTSGAYATYDTAPMSVGRSGASGGCPAG